MNQASGIRRTLLWNDTPWSGIHVEVEPPQQRLNCTRAFGRPEQIDRPSVAEFQRRPAKPTGRLMPAAENLRSEIQQEMSAGTGICNLLAATACTHARHFSQISTISPGLNAGF